ncbi:unnamed protein product, partial [Durusdinium trenchii]
LPFKHILALATWLSLGTPAEPLQWDTLLSSWPWTTSRTLLKIGSDQASKAKQEKQSTSHEVLLQDPARRPMACPRRSCPARTSAIIISCPDEAAYRAPHLRRGLWCIQNAMNRNLRNTGDLILLEELFPNAPGSTRHEEGGGLLRQVARSSEAGRRGC